MYIHTCTLKYKENQLFLILKIIKKIIFNTLEIYRIN